MDSPYGGRDGCLYAFRDEIRHKLPDACIVFEGGNDPPVRVPLAAGLVEDRVRAYQVEEGAEIPAQPYRHGRDRGGQLPGVGHSDPVLGRDEPLL